MRDMATDEAVARPLVSAREAVDHASKFLVGIYADKQVEALRVEELERDEESGDWR